ncbi:uncharacterized protein LOC125206665 [Salvia hispanica]|uniref:uncharacterized protein LOC125206665 n=1 Tax=Salvia hispanica TaxID=49212 RepID=UPI0020095C01|nr:uncharacterized protein LOC125206665 [Salvia hispanica]
MGRGDFFINLPSELTAKILSRLPLRSLATSECVCKPWRNLLGSLDFAKSLISDSETPPFLACLTPAMAENTIGSTRCTIFEIVEEVLFNFLDEEDKEEDGDQILNQNQNLQEVGGEARIEDEEKHEDEEEDQIQNEDEEEDEDPVLHELHYNELARFGIPFGNSSPEPMVGIAANGLFLLYFQFGHPAILLFIWNPLTRQYIDICRDEQSMSFNFNYKLSFGFGVSQISGQYKVVCINRDGSAHHVYTLGTGTWRRLEAGAASGFGFHSDGRIVCNGNLHWTVYDSTRPLSICGFDIEIESFSIFSAPPAAVGRPYVELSVLRDCLCVCYTSNDNIFLWSMKEYRVEESWTLEYRLSYNGFDFDFGDYYGIETVYPIKVFNDGDVLMLMVSKHIDFSFQKTRLLKDGNQERRDS